MAWPSNYQGCTIRGRFIDIFGDPIVGSVTFTPTPLAMLDFAAEVVIVPRQISVTLDADGAFEVVLPATDDPDISPIDWTYRVFESFVGGRTYTIDAHMGAEVDLVTASPVPDSLGNPIVRGPRGLDGAVLTVQDQTVDEASNVDLSPVIPLLANNASDYPNPAAVRAALGVLSAALHPETYFATAAQYSGSLKAVNNLADLANVAAALNNLGLDAADAIATLGLGSVASHAVGEFATHVVGRGVIAQSIDEATTVNPTGDDTFRLAPTIIGPLTTFDGLPLAGRWIRLHVSCKFDAAYSTQPTIQRHYAVYPCYTINTGMTPTSAVKFPASSNFFVAAAADLPRTVQGEGFLQVPAGATNLRFGMLLTPQDGAFSFTDDAFGFFRITATDLGAAVA